MRGKTLALVALLGGCALLNPRLGRHIVLFNLPKPRAQANPVAPYPNPQVTTRYRGLHSLGENERGNPEFLSTADWTDGEKRGLELVRLELTPDRRAVGISDGVTLETPPGIPYTVGNLWRSPKEGIWFADEEAPGLLKYSEGGKLVGRAVPRFSGLAGDEGLPPAFARGTLGPLVEVKGRVMAFARSGFAKSMPWTRVAEWDPALKLTTGEYFYPLDEPEGKVAGAAALDRRKFLVVESLKAGLRLFRADFSDATDLSRSQYDQGPEPLEATKNDRDLGRLGFRAAKKTPLFDLEGEGELDGFALVDYETVVALRSTEKGAILWLQRLEGKPLAGAAGIDNPWVKPKLSKPWARLNTETL